MNHAALYTNAKNVKLLSKIKKRLIQLQVRNQKLNCVKLENIVLYLGTSNNEPHVCTKEGFQSYETSKGPVCMKFVKEWTIPKQ